MVVDQYSFILEWPFIAEKKISFAASSRSMTPVDGGTFPQLLRVTCSICATIVPNRIRHNSTQSSCQLPTQGGAAWGVLGGPKLGTWTLAAHSRNFRGSFAKFHSCFPREAVKICKHLHSPSEQLQVVASLSGLCLPRLLVCDSGDRNRRILYALPGLGTEMLRLQFVSL